MIFKQSISVGHPTVLSSKYGINIGGKQFNRNLERISLDYCPVASTCPTAYDADLPQPTEAAVYAKFSYLPRNHISGSTYKGCTSGSFDGSQILTAGRSLLRGSVNAVPSAGHTLKWSYDSPTPVGGSDYLVSLDSVAYAGIAEVYPGLVIQADRTPGPLAIGVDSVYDLSTTPPKTTFTLNPTISISQQSLAFMSKDQSKIWFPSGGFLSTVDMATKSGSSETAGSHQPALDPAVYSIDYSIIESDVPWMVQAISMNTNSAVTDSSKYSGVRYFKLSEFGTAAPSMDEIRRGSQFVLGFVLDPDPMAFWVLWSDATIRYVWDKTTNKPVQNFVLPYRSAGFGVDDDYVFAIPAGGIGEVHIYERTKHDTLRIDWETDYVVPGQTIVALVSMLSTDGTHKEADVTLKAEGATFKAGGDTLVIKTGATAVRVELVATQSGMVYLTPIV